MAEILQIDLRKLFLGTLPSLRPISVVSVLSMAARTFEIAQQEIKICETKCPDKKAICFQPLLIQAIENRPFGPRIIKYISASINIVTTNNMIRFQLHLGLSH